MRLRSSRPVELREATLVSHMMCRATSMSREKKTTQTKKRPTQTCRSVEAVHDSRLHGGRDLRCNRHMRSTRGCSPRGEAMRGSAHVPHELRMDAVVVGRKKPSCRTPLPQLTPCGPVASLAPPQTATKTAGSCAPPTLAPQRGCMRRRRFGPSSAWLAAAPSGASRGSRATSCAR